MIKATTKSGTYYIIDFDNGCAFRVKGESSQELVRDRQWFSFNSVYAYPIESKIRPIQIGYRMYFRLRGHEQHDWIISSSVVSIEEVEDEYYVS